jgi:hypothetical protein
LFPNATLLAQAWDEAAAERVGEMLAGEGRSQEVDVVLDPTVNLHRAPLGGRLFEAYAEDPLLSGRLAAAYIRGIQRYGIGACVKHYVANESETQPRVNVRVSEAALRELYLLPFEICVVQISIADGLIEALDEDRVHLVDSVAVRINPTAAAPESIIDPQTGRPGMRVTSFDGSGAQQASTGSWRWLSLTRPIHAKSSRSTGNPRAPHLYASWSMPLPTRWFPERNVRSLSRVIRTRSGFGTKRPPIGQPHPAAPFWLPADWVTSASRCPALELAPHCGVWLPARAAT